jgi:[3-methyl-2-oxobutanoate dehydrogenase (acetyl-transferring)] kinase
MAQIYAKYFGGSLELISLYGYGCDVFLTLKNIGSLQEDVVI